MHAELSVCGDALCEKGEFFFFMEGKNTGGGSLLHVVPFYLVLFFF